MALQSILALSQNRKAEADALAKQAVAADNRSAAAHSALSYVQQGQFDLEQALASAERAAALAPQDALVWARLAELRLALGRRNESRDAAAKAFQLDPNLERTQTVAGFSQLFDTEIDRARRSFETAIRLDSSSPLARLGLGLAKIRGGDLEQGRRELEIAAVLDPENSLIRSYLAKPITRNAATGWLPTNSNWPRNETRTIRPRISTTPSANKPPTGRRGVGGYARRHAIER